MVTCYDEQIYLGFYLHLNKDIHIYRGNITYDEPLDSFRFILWCFYEFLYQFNSMEGIVLYKKALYGTKKNVPGIQNICSMESLKKPFWLIYYF